MGWADDGFAAPAALEAGDCARVLERFADRPNADFAHLVTDPSASGSAVRLDLSRGLNRSAESALALSLSLGLAPWVLVPIASSYLGYPREGRLVLDRSAVDRLRRATEGRGCGLGFLADPSTCVAQVLSPAYRIWEAARESLASDGLEILGYGVPLRGDVESVLDLVWVYRAIGRLVHSRVLTDLMHFPLQSTEWLFEEAPGGIWSNPSDGIREVWISKKNNSAERYLRRTLVSSPLAVERGFTHNLAALIYSDVDGWTWHQPDGVAGRMTTDELLDRLETIPGSSRIGLVVDPVDVRWQGGASHHGRLDAKSDLRRLPYPFDHWLSVSNDIDWGPLPHVESLAERTCDELGLAGNVSAYLLSRSRRWPAWELSENSDAGESPGGPWIGRWSAEGVLDTVHGLAWSFESFALCEDVELGETALKRRLQSPLALAGYEGLLLTLSGETAESESPVLELELEDGRCLSVEGRRLFTASQGGKVLFEFGFPAGLAEGAALSGFSALPCSAPVRIELLQTLYGSRHAVRQALTAMAKNRLHPSVFTAHGGGEGAHLWGQLRTRRGLEIYPETADWALDRPNTPFHSLPLLKEAGVRFYNPLDILFRTDLAAIDDLLQPLQGQDKTPYYAFERFFLQEDPNLGFRDTWAHGKQAASAQALASVLSAILRRMYWGSAGSGAIVYTHLADRVGNQLAPRLGWSEELHAAWENLSEYTFARDRTDGVPFRLWFAPPSAVLAFAAVMRGLASNLALDGNNVRITSWHDDHLGCDVPDARSFGASWLHGVTVYVPDTRLARVWIDEREITRFTRNPADASGRSSVTLVDDSGELALVPAPPKDPLPPSARVSGAGSPVEVSLDATGGASIVELSVANVPLRNVTHWTFRVRVAKGTPRWSVALVTDDGRVYEAGTSPEADWPLAEPSADDWRTETLALVDGTGPHRPHGRVTALRLFCDGGERDGPVAFSALSVLRPRPGQPVSAAGCILAGRVTDVATDRPLAGVSASLSVGDRELRARTGESGFYIFRDLPNGSLARLEVGGERAGAYYRRGRDVLLTCDQWDFDVKLLPTAEA